MLSIASLVYHFNGEDAKKWYHGKIKSRVLRLILTCCAALAFIAMLSGLMVYTKNNPANSSPYDAQAYQFITSFAAENEDMLFVGDNPHDRYKPDTLEAPRQGADKNLLAGSYDLYSPRAKDQMAQFGIKNPLIDCIGREDIGYIKMSFTDTMVFRLIEKYQIYLNDPVDLGQPELSEQIYLLIAYTEEEIAALREQRAYEEEQAALLAEALDEYLSQLEAEDLDGEDDHNHR
jgi:hypothetical protein